LKAGVTLPLYAQQRLSAGSDLLTVPTRCGRSLHPDFPVNNNQVFNRYES